MEFKELDSELLKEFRYDEKLMTLDLVMRFSNRKYRYFLVPASVPLGLETAVSPGTYFHCYIKGKFEYEQLF